MGSHKSKTRRNSRPRHAVPGQAQTHTRAAGPYDGILSLQRATGNRATGRALQSKAPVPPEIEETLRSPGQPLDPQTRASMEARLNHDLHGVRVHRDTQAADAADSVNAKAFTVGEDIVMGPGEGSPDTATGQRTLAHELAHVVQQSRGGPAPQDQLGAVEGDAARAAGAVSAGQDSVNVAGASSVGLARDKGDEEFKRFLRWSKKQFAKSKVQAGTPLEMQPHKAASTARKVRGVTGSQQSAHVAPTSAVKGVPGYSRSNAATYLLERGVHTGMDRYWKEAFQQLRRQGETEITAEELHAIVTESIERAPKLAQGVKDSLKARASDEIFMELGLKPTDKVKLPYPNIKPGSTATPGRAAPKKTPAPQVKSSKTKPAPATKTRATKTTAPAKKGRAATKKPPPAKSKTPAAEKTTPAPKATKTPPPSKSKTSAQKEIPGVETGKGKPNVTEVTKPPPEVKTEIPPIETPEGPGMFKGVGTGLASFALPIIAGWIHGKAVEERIEKKAETEGYVPYGAPSGEGRLYDIGAWLLDPGNDADKAVGLAARFKIDPWREKVREVANSRKPGEFYHCFWQEGGHFTDWGEQIIEDKEVYYLKLPDGKWIVYSSEMKDPPDLNLIIDPNVSNEAVKRHLEIWDENTIV